MIEEAERHVEEVEEAIRKLSQQHAMRLYSAGLDPGLAIGGDGGGGLQRPRRPTPSSLIDPTTSTALPQVGPATSLDQVDSEPDKRDEDIEELAKYPIDDACSDSYETSVFSPPSIQTSTSPSQNPVHLASSKDLLVSMLTEDQELDEIFKAAVITPQVGPQRLERNFKRLLVEYGQDLAALAQEESHRLSVRLIRTQALHVSQGIRQKYDLEYRDVRRLSNLDKPLTENQNALQIEYYPKQMAREADPAGLEDTQHENYSDDDEPGDLQDEHRHLNAAKVFLIGGQPFQRLKIRLRDFVHPHLRDVEGFVAVVLSHNPTRTLIEASIKLSPVSSESCQAAFVNQFSHFLAALETESHTHKELALAETLSKHRGPCLDHFRKYIAGEAKFVRGERENDQNRTTLLDPRQSEQTWNTERVFTSTQFVLQSTALRDLVSSLRDYLCRSQYSANMLNLGKQIDAIGKDGPGARKRLNSILAELYYADPAKLEVVQRPSASWVNQAKIRIEAITGSSWDWWPLSNPPDLAADDSVWLTWTCRCGNLRSEALSISLASMVTAIFASGQEQGEAYMMTTAGPGSDNDSAQSGESTAATGTSQGAMTTCGGRSPDSTAPSSYGTFDDGRGAPIPVSSQTLRYVFLLVAGARYRLAQIDTQYMTTLDFFQVLRKRYIELRGMCWVIPWRYIFSIYVFHCCDFLKIERYGSKRYAPREGCELPKDPNYFYKTIETSRPISKHVFQDLFYACYGGDSFRHRLHARFCDPLTNLPNLLQLIPRRCYPVLEECPMGDLDVFWGIVAREQISFAKCLSYAIISLIPSVWFAFHWMFGWGHDGDLQNAAVPLATSFAMLAILVGAVFAGTEAKLRVE
ncbi:hypothetical protein DL768_003897 [Monosporascus sp. mg162]|nr:hypothetical protein DL768_003897 [Monosporascus sp. mg162]